MDLLLSVLVGVSVVTAEQMCGNTNIFIWFLAFSEEDLLH